MTTIRKIVKFSGGDALASSEVRRVSGGSWEREGCLRSAPFALTCCVGALLLMTAEDLPSLPKFWVVCGGFISAGSGKQAFLATQSHTQVSTSCD